VNQPSRIPLIVSWICQIAAAAILAQTLFFKFTYAPETQWIFGEKLHTGRAGATFTGLVELTCVILLLVPRTAIFGAGLSLMTMIGALLSHAFVLGLESRNPVTGEGDGGFLFYLALTVLTLSIAILTIRLPARRSV
jgi:uncharacterized membrane protein YphA (DoxX/SURF4 family)